MSKINNLGKAKPGSRMFTRGYTINLAPNAIAKQPTTEKPPAKPKRKKKPGKK
jgi:hypothetical protein